MREAVELWRKNRNGVLKAVGNAIVPQVAALFLRAVMDSVELTSEEK